MVNEAFKEKYVQVTGTYVTRGRNAVLVDINDEQEYWIPLSCVHSSDEKIFETTAYNEDVSFRLSVWKAREIGVY